MAENPLKDKRLGLLSKPPMGGVHDAGEQDAGARAGDER